VRAVGVVAAGALAAAPAILAAAAVERAIAVPGPGRVVVTLDAAVYEGARADLGDLRVIDAAGTEVPYLVEHVADEAERPIQQPRISNRVFTRGQQARATLDFGAPTLKSQLTLSLSGDNFRRRVTVEGRARGDERWETLTDSAYVFAVPASSAARHDAARYETVLLPENNFPLLRVTVHNGPDDPDKVEILGASTRPAPRRRPREVPLTPRLTRREDAPAQETILTLDLGARHQPFRGLRLDVSDAAFFRGVVVEARVDPEPARGGDPAPPLAWRYLGEGAIYRYGEAGETREGLRLDLCGRERVLRLRIRNRDDRPLAIAGVTALVPVERLAFEAGPGAQYRLRYGDPRLSPPSYDLARTAGDPALYAARARDAALLESRTVPEAPPPPPPWTERNPTLLWAGLIAVVAALGAVTWRALRTAG
jgi:Protein of unknown function (DUF3999)